MGAVSRATAILLSKKAAAHPSVSEEEATMAGILVYMSVAMSWSGFVEFVHDDRGLQSALQSRSELRRLRFSWSVLKGISSALKSTVHDNKLK